MLISVPCALHHANLILPRHTRPHTEARGTGSQKRRVAKREKAARQSQSCRTGTGAYTHTAPVPATLVRT